MTPTSATGRTDARRGFTLVEMLAVVAIAAMAAGAVILTLPDTRPSAGLEAERLAARLVRAREEAVLTNRPVAVEIDAGGYAFSRFDGVEWEPLDEGPFRDGAWSRGTALAGAPARVVFDPTGAAEPARARLTRDGRDSAVSVDGAGEVRVDD